MMDPGFGDSPRLSSRGAQLTIESGSAARVASASAARTRLGETGIVAWCDTGEFQQGVVVTITSCTVKIDRATRAHFRRGCLKDLHPTDVWRRAISTRSN
jgi:hypothetical protein